MEDIIAQFIKLPSHVKTAVSSAQAIEKLEAIETRYDVKLADIVMRVAVKNIPLAMLQTELMNRLGISQDKAKAVARDMSIQLFSNVAKYLGYSPDARPDAGLVSTPAHEASLGIEKTDPEIEKHTVNLSYAPQDTTFDVDRLVNQLLDVLNIGLDHVIKKRFHTIVESRLVDVRDKQMVKDQLMRSTKIGGMGFSEMQANRVLPIIEQAWEDVHAKHLKIKEVTEATKHPTRTPVSEAPKHPPIMQQRVVEPVVPKIEKPIEPPKPITPVVAPPPISIPPITPPIVPIPKPQAPVSAPVEQLPEDVIPPRPKKEVPHFMPKVRRDFDVPEKTVMHDIVPPSKLVGPIEELEQMTVDDFRHLGDSSEESAERLKEKIRMLEKQSFELRSAGIKAWRSSPLMKEYLDIGRESIEKTRDIKQLIADKRMQNPRAMSSDEFEAISSVNTTLRY